MKFSLIDVMSISTNHRRSHSFIIIILWSNLWWSIIISSCCRAMLIVCTIFGLFIVVCILPFSINSISCSWYFPIFVFSRNGINRFQFYFKWVLLSFRWTLSMRNWVLFSLWVCIITFIIRWSRYMLIFFFVHLLMILKVILSSWRSPQEIVIYR